MQFALITYASQPNSLCGNLVTNWIRISQQVLSVRLPKTVAMITSST